MSNVIEAADEMSNLGPTLERVEKSDFTHGKPRRVLTVVKALRNSGDIGDDAVSAAERWYRDYVFAETGYFERLSSARSNDTLSHDQITFGLQRGEASARISEIRNGLGLCAHIRLVMMLVHEMSFAEMGRKLFSHLGPDAARNKVGGQCGLILTQLAEFYAVDRRKFLPTPR